MGADDELIRPVEPGIGRHLEQVPRRSVLTGAAGLAGMGFLAACGNGSPAANDSLAAKSGAAGIRITDQRGKTAVFKAPVTRVVTMPMPAASIVVAVDGSADHLVGMNRASWVAMRDGFLGEIFPDALKIAHDVAGQDFAPNVESILALKPDVVVQWGDHGADIITPMENAGLTVLGLSYGTQEDVNTWIRVFAAMLGKPERADQILSKIDTQLKQVTARTAKVSGPAPKILYFFQLTGGLKVAGKNSYNDYYIKLVGGTNPAAVVKGSQGVVGVDIEQVLAWDPDIVLIGNFDPAMPDEIYTNKVWQDVSAVRSRRVYKVPLGGYRWDPPGQESPLMWQWLSRIAFPGAKDGSLRKQAAEYYQFLYNHTPTAAQLDKILWKAVNSRSANYKQFDAP